MDPYPHDEHPSVTFLRCCRQDMDIVHAEGIEYVNNSRCYRENDMSIVPSLLHVPDHGASLPWLGENRSDHSSNSNSQEDESMETPEKVMTHSSNRSANGENSPPISWRNRLFQPQSKSPVSENRSTLGGDRSEDAANNDAKRRSITKKLLENMRHTYNTNSVPGPQRLTRCSCTSCWAENIHMITNCSLEPTTATTYQPTRVADKCDRPRPAKVVKFSETLETLTYDVWGGEVFDYEKGTPDFSCVHKTVGIMRTTGSPEADHEEMFSH